MCALQTPNPAVGAYSSPPVPLAFCPLTKNLYPALGLRPQISWFPRRQISTYAHGFREQSKLLQRVPLQRKDWKTLL